VVVTNFTLYGTSACHLCELAEAQLEQLCLEGRDLVYRKVDIAADDSLMERYGVLIPVLRRDHDGAELNWPFQPDDVMAMF
tara:strand:- start:745 stop:987 length:243 start_codon:yes stop_codon:yes gene_type:complete